MTAHPTLIAPKQRRSHRMVERVSSATTRLLKTIPFSALSMADIAREADISVGSIYSRFPSKERLLCFLTEQILFAEPDSAASKLLQPLRQLADLRAFLTAYINGVAEIFERHRAILAPMSAVARESTDGELRSYLSELNAAAHARLREAMLQHRREITHPSPEKAVDVAILWMGASLREGVLFREPVSQLIRNQDEFIAELAAAIYAYLAAERPCQ